MLRDSSNSELSVSEYERERSVITTQRGPIEIYHNFMFSDFAKYPNLFHGFNVDQDQVAMEID
jgi:hypothetical protein